MRCCPSRTPGETRCWRVDDEWVWTQGVRAEPAGKTPETHLHEQVKVAEVVIAAGRRVTAHDLLAIDLRRHGDVLTNRKTEDIVWVRQRKAVAARNREG